MRVQQDPIEREEILAGLNVAAKRLDAAKRNRASAITLARTEGLSNASIGEALGLTEGAVRAIAKRSA